MLLRNLGSNMITFTNVYCYNRCHGKAVKGFWALWDYIYDCWC
jgi:hypothetical protein